MRSLLLSFLVLGSMAHAVDFRTNSLTEANPNAGLELKGAYVIGVDPTGKLVRLSMDANGNIATSSGVSGTTTVGGYINLSPTTYVAGAINSINLTSTAGYAGPKPIAVKLSSDGAFRWEITNSLTPPAWFSGSIGSYQAASTTAIVPLEMSTNGQGAFLHLVGPAGVSTTVIVNIYRKE